MAEPKRHHWWPEVQSKQWAGDDGKLYVVRADGSSFKTSPANVGVEGELYTRLHPSGQKDREIERWFSREIETPVATALPKLIGLESIERRPFPNRGDPEQRKDVQDLGFIIKDYDERMDLLRNDRIAIVNYLAAMVVRSPNYLEKLTRWHAINNGSESDLPVDPSLFRSFALENMLVLYDIYRKEIAKAYITLTVADCDREFFFSDAGVVAKEPWSKGPMPFDIYAPLTPKLALNVLPVPDAYTHGLWVARVNSQGVARYNRIIVGGANRFVFTKSDPPLEFIKKNFGIPAPAPIGRRWRNGRIETIYERSRDRPL